MLLVLIVYVPEALAGSQLGVTHLCQHGTDDVAGVDELCTRGNAKAGSKVVGTE